MHLHAMSSVSSVTGPSRAALYRATRPVRAVRSARGIQAAGNVPTTSSPSDTPDASSATPPDVSLGVLLSVAEPSSHNTLASLDYQTLKLALESNNLATAQQAYVRLQSDVLLNYSIPPAPTENAGGSSQLNIAA